MLDKYFLHATLHVKERGKIVRNSKTLHLKNCLLRNLQTGLFAPGEMIPSEHALASNYGLTRPTVRTVLAELCAMGLLEKRPGVGTFVCNSIGKESAELQSIRIGSDIVFFDSEYFSRPIAAGVMKSPYAAYSNFSFISLYNSKKSELSNLDALLLYYLAPNQLNQVLALKKPVVQVACALGHPQIGFVTVDHQEEARRGVEYLIRYGYQKIAIIGGLEESFQKQAVYFRTRGWKRALAEAGLPCPDKRNFFPASMIEPISRKLFLDWLNQSDFDAVFFTNGIAFLNTYPYMLEHFGKSFYDLKVLIFDDLSKMQLFQDFSAAFIRQPLKEYGQIALEYLHRKVQDPAYPVLQKTLRCSIIIQ